MTIKEALDISEQMRPSQYRREQKLSWLTSLDVRFYLEMVSTHLGSEQIEFAPYTVETEDNTKLLIRPPYDEVYLFYIFMMMDLHNHEISKFNDDAALFNARWREAIADYNRTVMPRQRVTHFKL